MCGIIGSLSRHPENEERFIQLRDRLRHRGPDDAGVWRNQAGTVIFGHRRLSIIDLSDTSHQPFVSTGGRCVIVFNGEVYNYLEIRKDLEAQGHHFRSTGDTEVVLAAYEHWGDACVERFNGMFAFAIYDQGANGSPERLFVARDRVGKKPFYYRHEGHRFEFSSELKGLAPNAGINLQALNHYLALGYVPFDLCIAEGIKKLLPGHVGVYECQTGYFTTSRYWQLPQNNWDADVTGEQLASEAWDLLKDSVRLRLRSDVPTGVFLSGGLDSSLIVAAAAEVTDRPVKTFTISVPGSALDESSHARLVADYFGTEHCVLELPKPSLHVLDELAPFVDEPLADSSILPTYLISQLTAEHVKVALGGDGGDELYGGYRHYQQPLIDQHRFGRVPDWLLWYAGSLVAKLPAGIRGRNRLASLRGGIKQAGVWGTPYFDINLRRRILQPWIVNALGSEIDVPERRLLRLMEDGGNDTVDALTKTDFHCILPDDFLVKVDRASMANSLEVRSPLLDYRLVEHAFGSIPTNWKVNRNERRRVQNLMAKKYLPKEFQLNRKQGFSVPLDQWLRKEDINRYEGMSKFVDQTEVQNLVRGQKKGRANGSRLFALIMLARATQNMSL